MVKLLCNCCKVDIISLQRVGFVDFFFSFSFTSSIKRYLASRIVILLNFNTWSAYSVVCLHSGQRNVLVKPHFFLLFIVHHCRYMAFVHLLCEYFDFKVTAFSKESQSINCRLQALIFHSSSNFWSMRISRWCLIISSLKLWVIL